MLMLMTVQMCSLLRRLALSQFQIAVLATLWRQARPLSRRETPNLSRTNSETKGSAAANHADWTSGQKKRRRETYTVLGTAAIGLVADQYLPDGDDAEHVILNAFYSASETRKVCRAATDRISDRLINAATRIRSPSAACPSLVPGTFTAGPCRSFRTTASDYLGLRWLISRCCHGLCGFRYPGQGQQWQHHA